MIKKTKRADIEVNKLIYWIIALFVLVLLALLVLVLKNRGIDVIGKFLNLFRFGR